MPGKTMVAVAAPDGALRLLNHHAEANTGLSQAEVHGHPVWDSLPIAEHAEMMRSGVLRTAAGEDVPDHRGSWKAGNGASFPVYWGYSGLRGESGEILGVVITGTDMRVPRRMQAELSESIDRQQAILDTAVDGILTIGEDGLILSFNRSAERIFGYRTMEVLGRNVSMLMPEPYRAQHDGYLDNYLTTRRKKIIGIGREVEGLRKDGTRFPLELSVGELIAGGQRIFTGIIRDITDRKQMELESRRRQDELAHLTRVHSMGDLAAGLAHEINQPLTAIMGHANAWRRMLTQDNPDLELLRESLEQISRQGERAAEIIRRLRKYVEKGEVEREPSSIDASVREVLELMQHEFKVRDARVSIKIPPGLPSLMLDRVQIEQVLVNLFRNALEAMGEAGVSEPAVELSLLPTEAPSGITLSVRDNGPGFGAVPAEELFTPFFTTKKQGLGQGLSICRRIVDAHGGRLWAEPNQPQGAAFHFWLPAEARDGRGWRGAA